MPPRDKLQSTTNIGFLIMSNKYTNGNSMVTYLGYAEIGCKYLLIDTSDESMSLSKY